MEDIITKKIEEISSAERKIIFKLEIDSNYLEEFRDQFFRSEHFIFEKFYDKISIKNDEIIYEDFMREEFENEIWIKQIFPRISRNFYP